jgi:polyisoprenoid-binding protein YceI
MRWNIDPAHSVVEFGVKHLGIATVKGRFRKFQGTAETDPSGVLRSLDVSIDPASIDTNVEQRDAHLRSADFFDVEHYPEMTFRSRAITPAGQGTYRVEGDLTMRGVTRPVTLLVEAERPLTDPWGNTRIAARASGTLNRKNWGLAWNQVLETGGFVVGDEVKVNLEVEAVAEAPAQPVAA